MKSGSRFQCAVAGLVLVVSAFSYVLAQTASATPDPFVAQLTSVPGTFYAFAGDLTANGRFVVFESNGNLDTQNPRNADANREIYILDYAQRRIFQLTNTKNVQKPPASPTPTPTPTATPTPAASPTPTPTPVPTPADPAQIKIEISSNRPVITAEPTLTAGRRTYTIVFSTNAPDPGNFDGTDSAALVADGNQEVWIYQLPEVVDTFDLSTGDDLPVTDLTTGTFRRITDTPPSRPLRTGVNPPDALDDNREATISDDGSTIAFISSRNIITGGNTDGNAELFLARATGGFGAGSITFAQGTSTQDGLDGVVTIPRYQQNPMLSANGGVVAFLSTANLASNNSDESNGRGNEEVFAASFSGSAVGIFRQITRTKMETTGTLKGVTLNLLSPGRRMSRDGRFIAYQSRAEDPTANTGTNANFLALFVSTVPTDATTAPVATKVGPRDLDIINFPTFTDYDPALVPHTLVWGSAQNFKPDGTAATTETEGLNQVPAGNLRPGQLFSTQFPVTASNTFTRLTKTPVTGAVSGLRPLASASRKRIAFSLEGVELGGGNGVNDFSPEVFYMLTPTVSVQASEALSFFTGASNMGPMSSADPGASPSPTPTPSPSPGVALGLSPGELSKVRSTVGLATSDKNAVGGSETARRPILPIELNGVSVSVNGSAAGLYFVGDSPAEGISFVNPIGLSTGTATVAVHDQKNPSPTSWRGFVQIVPSQPDIFTSTNDAGGVAMVCNVTNTAISGCVTGPFQVTTADSTGTQKPTRLEIYVTGLRAILNTETKVSFVNGTTTTDITPLSVRSNINMFGTDLITIELPSTLAGMAPIDYKLIVTVTRVTVFTSRAADTAATVTIIPGP